MHPEDSSSKVQPGCISKNENEKLARWQVKFEINNDDNSHDIQSKWGPSQTDKFISFNKKEMLPDDQMDLTD